MLERQGLRRMIYARTSAAFLHGAKWKRDVGTREWYEQNISTHCFQSTFWQQLGVKDHLLNTCNLQAMLVTDVALSVTINKFKYLNFVISTVLLKLEINQQSEKIGSRGKKPQGTKRSTLHLTLGNRSVLPLFFLNLNLIIDCRVQ